MNQNPAPLPTVAATGGLLRVVLSSGKTLFLSTDEALRLSPLLFGAALGLTLARMEAGTAKPGEARLLTDVSATLQDLTGAPTPQALAAAMAEVLRERPDDGWSPADGGRFNALASRPVSQP